MTEPNPERLVRVTGATGHIGNVLVRELAARVGWEERMADRRTTDGHGREEG